MATITLSGENAMALVERVAGCRHGGRIAAAAAL